MRKLILAVLLFLPLHAWADTCTKSASSPNNSSVPDGSPVSIYCDSNGNLYTTSAGSSGGGGSTTANQGTPNTAANAWPMELVFSGTPLALGQATEANSIPVVLPSNQTVNVQPASGTILDPCQSSTVAKSSVALSISTATTTSLVAASGSTEVYVCGYSFNLGGNASPQVEFEGGTGATCGGSTVLLTGNYAAITGTAPLVLSAPTGGTVFHTAPGSGLCAVSSGTSPGVVGVLTYVQQ